MSTGPTSFEIGTTIGDYQIISVIGRGGMGKVFKVRNFLSGRTEAMKLLRPDSDVRPDLVERFLREIKVVAALEHPGIASLRTALRVRDQILMIPEYVPPPAARPDRVRFVGGKIAPSSRQQPLLRQRQESRSNLNLSSRRTGGTLYPDNRIRRVARGLTAQGRNAKACARNFG